MIRRTGKSGFTLIEVLTALVLTGLVALFAHQLVSVCTGTVHQLEQARRLEDRQANGRRWLRAAFLSLEAGGDAGGFEGHRDHVTFTSWQQQPGGWFIPERVTLGLDRGALTVTGFGHGALVLADSVTSLALDYLLEPGADTKWVRQWLSPLSAPLAVRLRIARREGSAEMVDTLLCLIKERG